MKILEQDIYQAFPKAEPPPRDEFNKCRCSECSQLRRDFKGRGWWNVLPEKIVDNFGNLPLFTATGYHYYLPAFLLFALANFDPYGSVVEFLVYSLRPAAGFNSQAYMLRRKLKFSEDQKRVLISFLELIVCDPDMGAHHDDARAGLNFWQT
jgi:hypothetical protein